MKNKICNKCNVSKSVDCFSKDKTTKDGLQRTCRECQKKYRNDNKVRVKKYRNDNKDKMKEYKKLYYEENRVELLSQNKEYYENNREKINRRNKEYYENNREKINEQKKNYNELNKEKRNKRERERRKNDHLYNLTVSIRNLIGESFKHHGTKKTKTEDILGCTFEQFKEHIESQFEDWMNWDNKGNPKDGKLEVNKSWDIDHITPLSSAETEEDVIRLNHYTNLQPLCSYTNRIIKRYHPGKY